MIVYRLIIFIVFTTGVFSELNGQFPTGRGGIPTAPESLPPKFQEDYGDDVDTTGVFYFFIDNPNEETPFSDSLLNNFQQYDPVRLRDLDYMNLGILGSASKPIVYEPLIRKGFDVGLHQFDIYHTFAKDLPYYRLGKAYTNVSYTQLGEQSDAMLNAQFSRNFSGGLSMTIDYKRISMLGRSGQYPNQNARNTAAAFGIWYHSKGGNYKSFFSFAANTIEQEDNGGIEKEPVKGEFDSPNAADVFLEEAQSRHSHREFAYTQYYQIGGQTDSLHRIRRAYTLSHQIIFNTSSYKFFDEALASDSSYYGHFQTDSRGIRHFLLHEKFENSFRISTFKLSKRGKNTAKQQKDFFEVGLTHSFHAVEQEPLDTNFNNLFLTGRWDFHPNDRLKLETYAHLGLLDNGGDFRLSGELFFDLAKVGALILKANNQLYNPNLLQSRFFVSQREVWNNDFKKTLETNLSATYRLPQFQFEVSGRYHLLNNYIYFDTLAVPRQTSVPLSIIQLILKKNFKFWKLHLDNVITLQKASEEFIRLPDVYSKHSFYYAGMWFRVLNVQLGADLRFNSSYFADYYHPLSGQFQLQDSREVEFYPAVDVFFSMRVTKFRAFLKLENFTSRFITDRLFYQTAFYPHPAGAFRLGIKWRFVN